jgi:hypothetical protein
MSNFLIGCALGVLVAGAIAASLLAPWPIRVRLLAAAQSADPWLGLCGTPRLDMRAVTLAEVEAGQGRVELVVDEVGTGRRARRTGLIRQVAAPFIVAELDGWSALHTPLLMIIDEDRSVQLHGPHGAVADFSLVGEKI